jgi:hypothetical protein
VSLLFQIRKVCKQRWFWDPVRASGLHDLIYTGYANVSHALLMALCERWHTETNNFHLPVGEMSITLDDVVCLLHIPIEGWMLDDPKKVSRVTGAELMVSHLGVPHTVAVKNYKDEYGAYISYMTLKNLYEDHLSVATRLIDAQMME